MERETTKLTSSSKVATHDRDVRTHLVKFAAAIRGGNIEEIMSFYAPDIVAFDMMPPLEFRGLASYRKTWEDCFTNYFEFPVEFEFVEQQIFVEGDVAFTYALIHTRGTGKDGRVLESWIRNTSCLRKFDGSWLISHEHNSVPLESETGKGLMNLKPYGLAH